MSLPTERDNCEEDDDEEESLRQGNNGEIGHAEAC